MSAKRLSAVVLSVGMVLCVLMLSSCSGYGPAQASNKTVAIKYVKALEDGDIDLMVDSCMDKDIAIEWPAHFRCPVTGTNLLKGREQVRVVAKAWKGETAHKVEIVSAIAQGDEVAVLANVDRVFKITANIKTYEDHPMGFFLKFRNGKIVKAVHVFDALEEVEMQKAKKYKF